jgi:hypothetical protein
MADVGDEVEVKAKKKSWQLEEDRDNAELHAVLQEPVGRAVIWRILTECGVYKSAVGDATDIFRFEGKRDIGLWVMGQVFTSDPKAYTIMRNEADERQSARDLAMKGKNNG